MIRTLIFLVLFLYYGWMVISAVLHGEIESMRSTREIALSSDPFRYYLHLSIRSFMFLLLLVAVIISVKYREK
ncbi:hypothetical protein Kkor_0320 [Kangiella koreensis DSM 16069]|uniref:Uncharacterized protein n=1 Tax=Kangiella koreensis (strain DSM 16069 / JCM 12317 / KCTC 12182 / SW-125) TaxID=523791 RepID=C7R7J2_KANKD|nr:hypothetical protein Kkor_0320 [Kangiella koreensis DSM 16069]